MAVHLSAEQVQLALRLRARGLTLKEVGRQVSCDLRECTSWSGMAGGGRRARTGGSRGRAG